MSISFFWLVKGGGWGLSPSTSPANHEKLNKIQKWAFQFFLAGEGWWMGFESIDQPGQSSEVEHNQNMSISFFWVETGGGWGSSPLTIPANHQKFNVIQKMSISFFWLQRGGGWGLSPLNSLANIRSWMQYKNEHFILLDGEGWQMGFKFINQPGRSSEVNKIQKQAFHFFWLERSGGWGLSPSTSLANHQKLNVIQKLAFHFFGWRGMVDGVWVHHSVRPIIRSWA